MGVTIDVVNPAVIARSSAIAGQEPCLVRVQEGQERPPSGRWIIITEDLSLRGARFLTALTALTGDEVAPLMATLAGLHAAYWARADLESEFDWLETSTRGDTAKWWTVGGREVFELEMKEPDKAEAFDLSRHSVDRDFAALAQLQEENDREPRTVLHGDTHIGNCYLLPDGTVGLLDWQLMRVANWGNDVAYTLMTALDVEERRRSEADLVRYYLGELAGHGVAAPAWDEA